MTSLHDKMIGRVVYYSTLICTITGYTPGKGYTLTVNNIQRPILYPVHLRAFTRGGPCEFIDTSPHIPPRDRWRDSARYTGKA